MPLLNNSALGGTPPRGSAHRPALRSAAGSAARRRASHRASYRGRGHRTAGSPHRSAPGRAPWLCCCSSAPSPASAAKPTASPKRLSEVAGVGGCRGAVPGWVGPCRRYSLPQFPHRGRGWVGKGGCEPDSFKGCAPLPVWGMSPPPPPATRAALLGSPRLPAPSLGHCSPHATSPAGSPWGGGFSQGKVGEVPG